MAYNINKIMSYSRPKNFIRSSYMAPQKQVLNSDSCNAPLHLSAPKQLPQAATMRLPNNFENINSSEMACFSPLRTRDICGPVILSHGSEHDLDEFVKIDITVNSDAQANSYDCRGAVNLSSSMQSNVPTPFSGSHSHLGMPGSQWGQGYKYLSDHLNNSHYLTLRNEIRSKKTD